jgi:AcrR family transcriptional regulator
MVIDTTNFFLNINADISKKEKTQLRLIDAAIELLYEKSFHGSSVKEIAERASVSNGTFYNYFVDKEDIYSSASIYISRIMIIEINEKKKQFERSDEVLKAGHMGFINFLASRPKWAAVLIQSQRGHYALDVWSLNRRRLSADVKRGIKDDYFSIKFDSFLIDQIMQIALHSIGQQIIHGPSKTLTNKASVAIMRLLKYVDA